MLADNFDLSVMNLVDPKVGEEVTSIGYLVGKEVVTRLLNSTDRLTVSEYDVIKEGAPISLSSNFASFKTLSKNVKNKFTRKISPNKRIIITSARKTNKSNRVFMVNVSI